MNALGFSLPATSTWPVERRVPASSIWRRWWLVVFYALAMAWVESAVVFYLRFHMNRLVPYQPNPLPEIGGFAFAEIVREAATMVMLAMVGCLAGETWRSRVAFALVAFGIWDIGYYVWLAPLTGWPRSVFEWDILFLIPLPWWGPVWSPVSIALLMIIFGTVVAMNDSPERPLWPGRTSCCAAGLGIVVALSVFMSDSLRVILGGRGMEDLRETLPQPFNWPLFVCALSLLSAPVVSVIHHVLARDTSRLPASYEHRR